MLKRLLRVGLVIAAPLALIAGPGPADAVTIGGNPVPTTGIFAACGFVGTCTVVQTLHDTPPAEASSSGVITTWRARGLGTVRLRVMRLTSAPTAGSVTVVGGVSSASETLTAALQTFKTRLPIRAGEVVGLDQPAGLGSGVLHDPDAPTGVIAGRAFTPAVPLGQSAAHYDGGDWELRLDSTVEPDVDRDGYGDKTQDRCPSSATAQTLAACPSPVVSGAFVSNRTFAVDSKGPAEVQASKRKPAKRGTVFSYGLSEQARVVFVIERSAAGRKVGGKCKRQTRSNRRRPRCARYTKAGSFAQPGAKGSNIKSFSGKIGQRKLKPGPYRATLVATNISGKHSRPARVKLKVVKR